MVGNGGWVGGYAMYCWVDTRCMVGWIRDARLGGYAMRGWVDRRCVVGWLGGYVMRGWVDTRCVGGYAMHGWVDTRCIAYLQVFRPHYKGHHICQILVVNSIAY